MGAFAAKSSGGDGVLIGVTRPTLSQCARHNPNRVGLGQISSNPNQLPLVSIIDFCEILKRFYMVKPCPKEMKCDVELSSYAIRDVEEYKNFCDRPKGQRPQPEEVIGDIAEHLTTIHLSRCERGKRCLYEGSSPPGGFPNTWGGASYCSSDLTIHRNGEVHTWDRGYDEEGNQVWGPKTGSYEFKPARLSNNGDMFSPLDSRPIFSLDKMESSFVVNEQ
ncbi:hypothetical protein ZIOFF_024230 [Zingiber officinale]|uniref:Uncharacterized protein n=1 Tax=Zingiber officinale TaxID=94328 RepID=A0A8J5GT95_ZINOF|nr:hypothetical protein ZIOFF_024230 [Zingiber officinale]